MNSGNRLGCIAAALLSLAVFAGNAWCIPYALIPNGSVRLQYTRNWSKSWSDANESFQQGYKLGAVGFIFDPRLMKYRIDTSSTVADTTYSGAPYSLDVSLKLIDVGANAPWRLARLPHPVSISYSRFTADVSTVSSYGFGMEWELPRYIHLFGDDGWISLSRERGSAISSESSGVAGAELEWGSQEFGYDQQPSAPDVEDEGWGEDINQQNDEWVEESGPVGWGNGPGIWNARGDVKDAAKGRSVSRKKSAKKITAGPPLVSIPFPLFQLNAMRNEFGGHAGTTTSSLAAFRMAVGDYRYTFSSYMTYSDITTDDGDKLSSNTVELSHLYRPQSLVIGPVSRQWTLANTYSQNAFDTNTGDTHIGRAYRLSHSWFLSDSRAGSQFIWNNNFNYGESSISSMYSLGTTMTLRTAFGANLVNDLSVSADYSRQNSEIESEAVGSLGRQRHYESKSASVTDGISFSLFKFATCAVNGGLDVFSASEAKQGGWGRNGSVELSFRSVLPLVINGFVSGKDYDNGWGESASSLSVGLHGYEMFSILFNATAGDSRSEMVASSSNSYNDELRFLSVGFRRGVARGITLSGLGRVERRAVLKGNVETRVTRKVGSVTMNMAEKFLMSRHATVSLAYQYHQDPLEGELGTLSISPRFRYYFKMFALSANYDYNTVLQGSTKGNSTHAVRIGVNRPFGYIPRQWL